MKLAPSLLQPLFTPRIWGSRSLAPLYPQQKNLAEPIGEVWLTGRSCRFANGPFTGQELGEAWRIMRAEWKGTLLQDTPEFPLLVKFIFPDDKLSIQVHPDDAYAREHEAASGGLGKTEMWCVVSAKPDAQVLLGFRPGVTAESFRQAITEGTLEETLAQLPVHTGDVFFVPAGTPHTIGPKMVLCEVQEYSDLTYRIFDYNRLDASGRPRDLHLKKALEVLRFGGHAGGNVTRVTSKLGLATRSFLVACSYFAAERWEFSDRLDFLSDSAHFDVLIIFEGAGTIRWPGGTAQYNTAEAWFIPAGLGAYELEPADATKLLRTYLPNLEEFSRTLASQGFDEPARSRVLFP